MATREDFLELAEMLGVTLDTESLRNLRSLERGGILSGDTVVMARRPESEGTIWLIASKRALIVEASTSGHEKTRVGEQKTDKEHFFSNVRFDGIGSEFVLWPESVHGAARCCWKLEI